jgi:CHAD domain-containing protein
MKSELRELSVSAVHTPSQETKEPRKSKLVEEENDQRLKSRIADAQATAPIAETPDSITIRRALRRLLRKRVKKFVGLLPEMHADANPKAVHDARVWSRRLQQAVSAFFPKPRSRKVRRLRRTPRQVRRVLGEWRNCDVLLEMVARQQRRTRSETKRHAWAFVHEYLLAKRSKQVARAQGKLLQQDLEKYAALAQKLIGRPPDESAEVLMQRLRDSVQGAWHEWQSALAHAQETRALSDLHAFRVATKDLRYRTELLYDVGSREMRAQLKWLKDLQDALGVWHDRQVLNQAVAEAIGSAKILLTQPKAARILLSELEKDRSREAETVEKIFCLAIEHPGRKEMEWWSVNPSPLPPHPPRKGLGVSGKE